MLPDTGIEQNNESSEDEFHGFESTSDEDSPANELRRTTRSTQDVLPVRLHDYEVRLATHLGEPSTYSEALTCKEKDQWQAAMKEELKALEETNTWTLVPLPKNRKCIGCKWVYRKKNDGSFRARLVAQGFAQRFGYDYGEVFAPVAMQTTFRVLLTVAGQKQMLVQHIDIKTAYLYGRLEDEIYMRQPQGFETSGKEDYVCKLNRSLYGLKQAARIWNHTIKQILVDASFKQSKADACLYFKEVGNNQWVYLLIYVDDLVVVSCSMGEIKNLERILQEKLKITVLGEITNFLGINVVRRDDGIFLINQRAFIRKIEEKYGLNEARKSKIPMDTGYYKNTLDSEILPNNVEYHSLVGALLYIATNTRPDIAACVSILSRKIKNPTKVDWTELKRIVRYLSGTANYSLMLGSNEKLVLEGYSDSDWASDASDRKSNSGFVFKLGSGAISWASRKQSCVSNSTMEAEYVALAEAVQETVWLRRLLSEVNVQQINPTIIWEDNRSCIDFTYLEKQNRRSKHIDTKFHYTKELVATGAIELKYCATENMLADIMTKPLAANKVQKFVELLGLISTVELEEKLR